MPRLVQETNEEPPIPLQGPCVAGRLASCALTLKGEPQSSRQQFEVYSSGTLWLVKDLESRNGTFLNDGRLTAPAPLRHDDRIRVGETVIRFDAQPTVLPEGLELGNVILGLPCGRSPYGLLYGGRRPSLDRDVTVEVLDPDQAGNPEARGRYQQRARAAGAFEHSAIVAVFDVAATKQAVYTVFEAFPPQTLDDRLRRGAFDRSAGLTVMRLTAEALHHVHTRKRIHGCLTPRSIRLEGEAKAKLTGLGEPKGSRLRPFPQDPHELAWYASPEEAKGAQPEAASDIYSLGLVACRLLGGDPAVQGKKQEALDQHASDDPLDLSQTALDWELQQGLGRLLAKDPEARPTAREAAGLFLEWGGGGALSASSAIRRKKKLEASGHQRNRPRPQDKAGSARQAKAGSAPQKAKVASAPQKAKTKVASAPQKAKSDSSVKASAAKRAGSARAKKGSAPHQAVPRRAPVSERALPPEPTWGLPARLGLLVIGYALIFSGAFLMARIALHVVG